MVATDSYVTTQDGVRLFCRTLGSGSKVVVIPNATYMFDDFKYLAENGLLITYDLRNRGRSDAVADASKLKRGIHNDVDDLETIRSHFGIESIVLIGHSYVGLVVALYAMKHSGQVNRVVQIGPGQPFAGKQYPAHLTGEDATMAEISAKMAELQKQGPSGDMAGFGSKLWALMRQLYVTDPKDAGKINWSVADLPNESLFNVMKYFNESLQPTITSLQLTADDFARMKMPVLVVHGTRDRQAPYGGGREWAAALPNARLLTIDDAAHLPWIENPERVFGAVQTFLDGNWPRHAERVAAIDPNDPIELLYGGMTKLGPGRDADTLVMHFRGDAMTAGEIAERFSCRWPTISRHMKILEKAQLVRVEKKGRERLYQLEKPSLNIARYWFTSFDN
jgi:proline iminopeptidase